MKRIILETRALTKRFGNFTANDRIDFDLREGEIHAIAGENGAGKSTLMKMLYGVYPVTSGEIVIDGEVQTSWKPVAARAKGIGMVFQDFRLIPAFTVMENVFISLQNAGVFLKRKVLRQKIREISEKYSLGVEPDAEVWRMDLGQRQHVEIIKVLLQERMRIMIFDEPTSVLAPHEIDSFLQMLSAFRDNGYSIVLITHKLHEIISVADRITILRQGKKTNTFCREDGFSQSRIVREMMGEDVELTIQKQPVNESVRKCGQVVSLRGLTVEDDYNRHILQNVGFDLRPGEILGVAGISGNGQKELAEVIYGVRRCVSGQILKGETDITASSPRERIAMGFRMVTEDPIRDNIVPTFSVLQNMALAGVKLRYKKGDIDWRAIRQELEKRPEIQTLHVPELERIAGTLSGGNLQRAAFARAVVSAPTLLIASYPSRGLDVATVNTVHQVLLDLREQGAAILMISEDLQELFDLSDRLMVLAGSHSYGPFIPSEVSANEIGKLMLKGGSGNDAVAS